MNVTEYRPLLTAYDPLKTYKGFTLLATYDGHQAILVNMKGEVFHRWEIPCPVRKCQLPANGNLLVAGKLATGPLADMDGATGTLLELDWAGKTVREYEDPHMHDDFYRMDNGHTLITCWVPTPAGIAARVPGGLAGTEQKGTMWADSLREIDAQSKVAWEWDPIKNLTPESYAICPLCKRSEWTHANSCMVLPDGNIAVSFSRVFSIVIIEHKTGAVIWRWGRQELGHSHFVSPSRAGHILVSDSGTYAPGLEFGASRIVEVSIASNEMTWQYLAFRWLDFYAPLVGNCQRLPNGNTLICEGDTGRVFEVTDDGEVVWELVVLPDPDSPRRASMLGSAYRYSPDYLGGVSAQPVVIPETFKKKKVEARLKQLGY